MNKVELKKTEEAFTNTHPPIHTLIHTHAYSHTHIHTYTNTNTHTHIHTPAQQK